MVKHAIFFISLIIAGCKPQKAIRMRFSQTDFCYAGEKYNVSSPINLQGYYQFKTNVLIEQGYPSILKETEIVSNVVFFADGSFVYDFDQERLDGLLWGRYVIRGDTIKGQFIRPLYSMSASIGYIWFKIIEKSSIQKLYFKYRTPIVAEEITVKSNEDMPISQFISLDSLSYQEVYKKNWLKHRKWYWCSEDEFKKWESQNQKK